MIERLKNAHIVIVGGGRFCLALLRSFFSEDFGAGKPNVLGVADLNPEAVGLVYAHDMGIFTTTDYKELFKLEHLDLIIELTKNIGLGESIILNKPPGVQFVDFFEARAILQELSINAKKAEVLKDIRKARTDSSKIETLFDAFYQATIQLTKEQDVFTQTNRKEMVDSERTLFQAIQGSTIATFLINKNHIVTHWNKACEKLTGYSANQILGTNHHWKPFRSKERPIMADLILDGVKEEEVWRYYGAKWKKSDLIDGAYEAEEYFEHLGDNGKWLFFYGSAHKECARHHHRRHRNTARQNRREKNPGRAETKQHRPEGKNPGHHREPADHVANHPGQHHTNLRHRRKPCHHALEQGP